MRRNLNGIWCECIDIGCDDFKAAYRNRKMVAEKRNILGYQFIETFVKAYPRNKLLPLWFPMGKLPSIAKSERRGMNQYGIYEIGYTGLIKVDENQYNGDIDE